MKQLLETIKVGFAFVGVVVGAGFATGQEILQFFTNYGTFSYLAIFITVIILLFGGCIVLTNGYDLKAINHTEPIRIYLGNYLGPIIDIILTVFLYCLAIIMTAGGSATLNESFDIPLWLGSLILVLGILVTLFLDFNKMVSVLGVVTPFLVIIVTIIAVYFFFNPSLEFSQVDHHIDLTKTPSGIWWWDSIIYASLQVAAAFSFLSVLGGNTKYRKSNLYGGILGGVILFLLIAMINSGLLSELDQVNSVSLPTLLLAEQINPVLPVMLSVIIILVIYNTVVGLIYSFAARFTIPYSKNYKILIILMMVITYCCTFIGFIGLISFFFPLMGYVGLLLLVPIFMTKKLRHKIR
ncbi:hypothetical protein [Bacillus inaquosorum]|uniref:YkvI family membrane protein n=1 Tax=Bacillus inaquosorum TaxID=483913 RepID=UPI0022809253|nr:hypothetical protein [Bacillus inaquosorum]MCY8173773.1 hypothetical protein [Bacillus inaquosorum]